MPGIGESGFTTPYGNKKRKQASQQPGSPVTPPGIPSVPEVQASTTEQNLALVEKHSAKIFPTQVSWALAGMDKPQPDIIKAAKIFAHQFDVKPLYLFGTNDPSKVTDPFTGQVGMSMRTMQRLTDGFSAVAVSGMLSDVLKATPNEVATRGGRGAVQMVAPPSTRRVGQFARAIGAAVDDSVDVKTGLGIAVYLAKQKGIDPKRFSNNLAQVLGWAKDKANQHVDLASAVSIAMSATQQGKNLTGPLDVVDFVMPQDVKDKAAAEAATAAQTNPAQLAQNPGAPQPQLPQYGNAAQNTSAVYALNQSELNLAYSESGPDIFAQAKALEDKIRMDQTAFQRSFLGRNFFIPMGNAYAKVWRGVEEGVVTASAPFVSLELAGRAALGGTKTDHNIYFAPGDVGGGWAAGTEWRNEAIARLRDGESLGYQAAVDNHLPPALGNAADFALNWYLDPFVLLGKGLEGARAMRLLPGLEEGESFVGRAGRALISDIPGGANFIKARQAAHLAKGVDRFQTYADVFASSRDAKGLWKAIYKNTDNSVAYTRAIEKLPHYFADQGMSQQLMAEFRSELLKQFPQATKESLHSFREAVFSHWFGFGPEGSVANEGWKVYLHKLGVAEDVAASPDVINAAILSPHTSGLMKLDGTANDLSRSTLQLPDTPSLAPYGPHIPASPEIPSALNRLGIRRLTHEFITSDFVTKTGPGRRVQRLFTYNPGRVLEYHNAPDVYGLLHARYWDTFTETEARGFQAQILEAMNSGVGFEARIDNVIDDIDQQGFTRWLEKRYQGTIGEVADAEMRKAAFEYVSNRNAQLRAFGVVPTLDAPTEEMANAAKAAGWLPKKETYGDFIRKNPSFTPDVNGLSSQRIISDPVMETNIRNVRLVVNPIEVQSMMDQYIGASRRWMSHLRNALGREQPELNKKLTNALSTGAVSLEHGTEQLAQAYRSLWKGLTVARPGYIPRVILTDEMGRFFTDTGSFADRLLAQRWSAVDASTPAGRAFGEMAGKISGYMDRHGFFDTTIYGLKDPLTGEDLVIPRSGAEQIMYEPLASQQLRNTELLDDMVAEAGKVRRGARSTGNFDKIMPGQPGHIKAWTHDLRYQFANSDPGIVGLKSVIGGDSLGTTDQKLLDWTYADNNKTLHAMGHAAPDAKQWATDLSQMTHYYTMGDKGIAEAALNQARNLEDMLSKVDPYVRKIPGDVNSPILNTAGKEWRTVDEAGKVHYHGEPDYRLPAVHGPSVEWMLGRGSRGTLLSNTVDKLYKYFVTMPEDVINRQPFYRVWKTRAMRGYAAILADAGVKELTPELRRAMDLASRDFALEQVKATMFEFTKQSRLTELISTVFPFPQPFFEGFQVWARLAVHHPEVIGRARALFQLGVDSGFLQKNADGEYIVPMGFYKVIGELTQRLGITDIKDWKHYSFYAPLSSFNMLSQSTARVPGGDNIIGNFMGGMPIPVPGFDPIAALVLQQALKNRPADDFLSSLVYQFGPQNASSVLPNTIKNGLKAFFPNALNEEALTSLQENILRSFQVNGIGYETDPQTGKRVQTMSTKELTELARSQAEDILGIAAIGTLFSPAALRIKDPGTDMQNELGQDIKDLGAYEGIKKFLDPTNGHPELTLFAVSKTFFSGYDITKYGEDRAAPRVPASQFAWDLLHKPAVQPFLHQHPEWAALLLVGMDPKVTDTFDFGVFSRMASTHFLQQKDPTRFWGEGENGAAWAEVSNWYKTVEPGLQAWAAKHGINPGDPAYTTRVMEPRDEMLTAVGREFPDWAHEHLQDTHTGAHLMTWKGYTGTEAPPAIAIHDARLITQMPGYESFPGVIALKDYLAGRDNINDQMRKLGIVDITGQDAIDAGLTKKYDSLVASIESKYPDFSPFISSFFRGDLTQVASPQADFLANVSPNLKDQVSNLDIAYNTKKEGTKQYNTTAEQYQGYQDMRAFWSHKQQNDPAAVDAWVKAMYTTPGKLKDERTYLSGLPSVFYSTVDWKLMGVDLTKGAQSMMDAIGQARVNMEKKSEAGKLSGNPYSKSVGYDAIDAYVKQGLAGKIEWKTNTGKVVRETAEDRKAFAEAINSTNTWGWGIKTAGLIDEQGRAGKFWEYMVSNAQYIQQQVDKAGMHGVNYDSQANETAYARAQKQLLDLALSYMKKSRPFEKQWYDLQDQIRPDGGLIQLFMPDDYFPLGGPGNYLNLKDVIKIK